MVLPYLSWHQCWYESWTVAEVVLGSSLDTFFPDLKALRACVKTAASDAMVDNDGTASAQRCRDGVELG